MCRFETPDIRHSTQRLCVCVHVSAESLNILMRLMLRAVCVYVFTQYACAATRCCGIILLYRDLKLETWNLDGREGRKAEASE